MAANRFAYRATRRCNLWRQPSRVEAAPVARVSAGSPPVHVESHQENHFHGSDIPTITDLNTLNRKQAIRLSTVGIGAR